MLVKSGQIVNPMIVIVDPVPYKRTFMFVNLLIVNVEKFAIRN